MIRGRYFPAAVVLPGQPQPWARCLVLLADDGLHVFRAPGEVADWHAEVDWAASPPPPAQRAARNGYSVRLDDGRTAVITASGGCGCGNPLKRWAGPSWASVERAHA